MMVLTFRAHTARGWEAEQSVRVNEVRESHEGTWLRCRTEDGALLEVPKHWIVNLRHLTL